jgi:hypothetical protein
MILHSIEQHKKLIHSEFQRDFTASPLSRIEQSYQLALKQLQQAPDYHIPHPTNNHARRHFNMSAQSESIRLNNGNWHKKRVAV